MIGVRPMLGRTFTAAEDSPATTVVILSHRLWTRRFGANASIVGSTIRMNGVSYTVLAVMPQSFDLTTDSEELWTPIAFTPAQKVLHDEHYLTVYGRLRRTPRVAQARTAARGRGRAAPARVPARRRRSAATP